jgi:hypothetical protein
MKKKLIIFLLFISIFILISHNSNPNFDFYSGKYTCQSNPNKMLVLKSNNSFVIYSTLGKNENSIEGTYTISNNHINLLFNDKNLSPIDFNISSGQVYGSVIIFSNPNSYSSIKFKKL